MKLSHRLASGSTPNALSTVLAEKRAQGVPILDLTESNPTRAGIHYPDGFLTALADDRSLLYEPEPFGLPSARQCIAQEYGVPYDNVVMTAGTSEAYSWIFKLLCDPGCEVLIPRPSYPLFEYLAALESVTVRHYSLFYDHGWFIDFHTIERAITERTRAIVVVNPNNPTGHFLRRHELDRLLAICGRHDIAIVSDEVFGDYRIDVAPDSVLTLRGIADFTLNGLSKLIGLPQMKLAWMIAKQPVPELEIIADTYLSVGTPVQAALAALLELRAPVQAQILERVRANLALLERKLRVEAGWYAVIPIMDEEETVLSLLRDRNTLVQPGYFYDFERSGYIVASLLTSPEIFRKGLTAISAATKLA
ncbi:MAG TPA: pyridoxal phosphate-dependent aminotransferase [Bryobacteraceae bacterium]|nr:pyridoxal phosphate-dependent aminotransferase [Bryobacteraceae bacterium]